MTGVGSPVSSEAWDQKSLRWMSLQSTLRSGYKKMERDQDDRPLNRVPEDPRKGVAMKGRMVASSMVERMELVPWLRCYN